MSSWTFLIAANTQWLYCEYVVNTTTQEEKCAFNCERLLSIFTRKNFFLQTVCKIFATENCIFIMFTWRHWVLLTVCIIFIKRLWFLLTATVCWQPVSLFFTECLQEPVSNWFKPLLGGNRGNSNSKLFRWQMGANITKLKF